mgnify:CR=1 FL=1|tara:strand:+ start:238 stop:639 length:402 start_codon:yes stop_codon:yes gene_type:complete
MPFKLRSGNTPLYKGLKGLRSKIGGFRDRLHKRIGSKIDKKVSQFRERHPNAPNLGIYSRFQERNPHMFTPSQTLRLDDQSSHIASNVESGTDYDQNNVGAAAVANEIKMENTSAFTKKKKKGTKPFKMKRKY